MSERHDFLEFLSAAPSSFHAAGEVADRLTAAGFSRHTPGESWDASAGGHVLVADGAVVAWWVPEEAGPHSAFRIIGAHTDSPGFVIKPHGEFTAHGWRQLAVEVYGGPVVPSWFDRDLELAGRVVLADATVRLVRTGPVARIPHLAVHLDRSREFTPDRQRDVQPILGPAGSGRSFTEVLADAAGVAPADVAAFDLITVDAQPPALIGADQDLVAAGRMDNLSSVWAGLQAMLAVSGAAPVPGVAGGAGAASASARGGGEVPEIAVLACFDHEEVGSASPTGAGGPLLERALARTSLALGATADEAAGALARSFCVSADAAHSVHPNHPEKHDPTHQPIAGGGPETKINANQRYASTAPTVARWRGCLDAAGVAGQDFVGNNAVPCGSTIGPITATRLGVPTVDVGVPLLSMHSARELCALADVEAFAAALTAFLTA